MTEEYLKLKSGSRNSYFKKEGGELKKISSKEYKAATKTIASKRKRKSSHKNPIDEEEIEIKSSDEDEEEPEKKEKEDPDEEEVEEEEKEEPEEEAGEEEKEEAEEEEKEEAEEEVDEEENEEPKEGSDEEEAEPKKRKRRKRKNRSPVQEEPEKKKKRKRKHKKEEEIPQDEIENEEQEEQQEEEPEENGGAKKKRRKRKHKKPVEESSSDYSSESNEHVSLAEMERAIGSIIRKKETLANILGSSFSSEALGINLDERISALMPSAGIASMSGGDNVTPQKKEKEQNPQKGYRHVLSRTLDYTNSIKRQHVPDDFVPWEKDFDDYCPPEYSFDFKEDSDPIDIWNMPRTEFSNDKRPGLGGGLGLYKFDQAGRPLNPFGRTGLRGKGLLPYWGPNWYVFPIFIRKIYLSKDDEKPSLQLLFVKQGDKLNLPFPSSFATGNDTLKISNELISILDKNGIDPKFAFDEKNLITNSQSYLDHKYNTDNSWIFVNANVYSTTKKFPGDWVDVHDCIKKKSEITEDSIATLEEVIGQNIFDGLECISYSEDGELHHQRDQHKQEDKGGNDDKRDQDDDNDSVEAPYEEPLPPEPPKPQINPQQVNYGGGRKNKGMNFTVKLLD